MFSFFPVTVSSVLPSDKARAHTDYNFDYDIADQAIRWMRNQKAVAPDRENLRYLERKGTLKVE